MTQKIALPQFKSLIRVGKHFIANDTDGNLYNLNLRCDHAFIRDGVIVWEDCSDGMGMNGVHRWGSSFSLQEFLARRERKRNIPSTNDFGDGDN